LIEYADLATYVHYRNLVRTIPPGIGKSNWSAPGRERETRSPATTWVSTSLALAAHRPTTRCWAIPSASRTTVDPRPGNAFYGVMLYNAPYNNAPRTGPSRNQFAGNGIANLRAFSGSVASTAQTSSGQAQRRRNRLIIPIMARISPRGARHPTRRLRFMAARYQRARSGNPVFKSASECSTLEIRRASRCG
jgi:hypothetical protein